MDINTADQLMSTNLKSGLWPKRPDEQYLVSNRVRKILDTDGNGKISNEELRDGLLYDRVSFDPKTRQIIANRTRMAVDGSIFPHDKSNTFGTVEQCMEFIERYFKEDRAKAKAEPTESQPESKWASVKRYLLGGPDKTSAAPKSATSFDSDFGAQHNLSDDVRGLARGTIKKDGYTAYTNGDITPPRAGDILVAESDTHGTFHVALVTAVDKVNGKWQATVYQANVPYNTNSHDIKDHEADFAMNYKDGKWTFDMLPTSKWDYDEDMNVVGWIHPSCSKALPEAACN